MHFRQQIYNFIVNWDSRESENEAIYINIYHYKGLFCSVEVVVGCMCNTDYRWFNAILSNYMILQYNTIFAKIFSSNLCSWWWTSATDHVSRCMFIVSSHIGSTSTLHSVQYMFHWHTEFLHSLTYLLIISSLFTTGIDIHTDTLKCSESQTTCSKSQLNSTCFIGKIKLAWIYYSTVPGIYGSKQSRSEGIAWEQGFYTINPWPAVQ